MRRWIDPRLYAGLIHPLEWEASLVLSMVFSRLRAEGISRADVARFFGE
jgi:hypothetical protein